MQYTANFATAQTEFTMGSAPFTVYRYVGVERDPEAMARTYATQGNLPARAYKPDTVVRVQPDYKPNSLWRALVAISEPDSDVVAYLLAR